MIERVEIKYCARGTVGLPRHHITVRHCDSVSDCNVMIFWHSYYESDSGVANHVGCQLAAVWERQIQLGDRIVKKDT